MDGNSGVLVGNLTRDIEIEEITIKSSGEVVPKVRFSLARSWYVGEGTNRTQKAEFVDFEVWRDMALHLAASAVKGTRLIVEYQLRQDRWTNADNQSRSKLYCEVTNVGIDLRWATAEVSKAARADAGTPVPAEASEVEEGEVVFSTEPF